MEILPGFSTSIVSNMSPAQVKIYAAVTYLLIGLYTYLFVLVTMNGWNILIRQKRYKTLPLLAFYIFAFITISFRIVVLIWQFEDSSGVTVVSSV